MHTCTLVNATTWITTTHTHTTTPSINHSRVVLQTGISIVALVPAVVDAVVAVWCVQSTHDSVHCRTIRIICRRVIIILIEHVVAIRLCVRIHRMKYITVMLRGCISISAVWRITFLASVLGVVWRAKLLRQSYIVTVTSTFALYATHAFCMVACRLSLLSSSYTCSHCS